MLKVKVKGFRAYDFEDKNSGKKVSGINVFYDVPADENESGEGGMIQQKFTLPYSYLNEIQKLKSQFPLVAEIVKEDYFTSKGLASRPIGLLPVK